MQSSWRWFGPADVIPLTTIRQAGATGVVTALHHIPSGAVWSVEEIDRRKAEIEGDRRLGLGWNVVESLPVHERIKLGEGDLTELFDNYRQSMRNLAACGVKTICYNFMPALDWTRTELRHRLANGGAALRFNAHEFAAFDCFMLARPAAEADHPSQVVAEARKWFGKASESDKDALLKNIVAGLPGSFEGYDLAALRNVLARYRGLSADDLRANYAQFLKEVIPTAEALGVRMAVHPDDPPRPLMGLPRIVSNENDIAFVLRAVDSPANGLTLCAGSLGAGAQNDVVGIAERFAPRIYFAHLRNVTKEPDGSFMEAEHLDGDTDMVDLVTTLLLEQDRRQRAGDARWRIPFRPDHGHELADDIGKRTLPGYSAIGRLKGLAEIRGVMIAVAKLRALPH